MEYYIPPPQYKAPDFMATMQGFAGLANMADQAQMMPLNKKLAEANLQAVQQGVEQSKLMNPVQLSTAQTNLAILGNSLEQQKRMNPIQLGIAQNTKDLGDTSLQLARMQNELQAQKTANMNAAILEVQQNPSSKAAQNALLAFSAMDPSGANALEGAIGKTAEQQRRLVFDANFNAFIGMRNGSPESAVVALTQARDAAINSRQPELAAKFDQDLNLVQKDPQAAFNKFTLISASSPDHRQAMNEMTKVETLPSQVQAGVRKYVELADAAQKQGNTIGDLLRRWQEVPQSEAGGVNKLLSLARIATANETPTDVLRKETEAAFNLERLKAFKEEIGSMGIRNLKEFETALAGKSDPYSKKDQVITRLERILDFTAKEQAYQQANADWLTAFRGSSVATRDAVVNGIQIPKGSNVQQYKTAIAQSMFPDKTQTATQTATATTVTVTMPDGKVGKIPSDQVEAFKKKYPGAKFQ